MKIYKLDVDVAQPIRQVVQMQQNTTGALLVHASKDEHLLRNATIKLYDGETEIEPYSTDGDYATFKIAMGQDTKNLKLKVSATPLTSTKKTLTKPGTGRLSTYWCDVVQLPAGTYQQEELLPLVSAVGSKNGLGTPITLYPTVATESNANINRIVITAWNEINPIWFGYQANSSTSIVYLSPDEPIVVTDTVEFGKSIQTGKTGVEFSEIEYPSVGYYADYDQEIVVSPNSFAHFYAEQDLPDEEPVDSTDSELDSTDTELDSTDTELDSTDSELTPGLIS